MLPVWYPFPGTGQILRQYGERLATRGGGNRSASNRARIEADDTVFIRAEVANARLVIGQRRSTYRVGSVDRARARKWGNQENVAALSRRRWYGRGQNVVDQAGRGYCGSTG